MKNLGVFLLGGIGVLGSFVASSQGIAETALLFSRVTNGGSARMQGMGGAQVSLGGDFSSASSNPAGLGMFNRSEFSITPSYSNVTNVSKYFGNTVNQSKSNLSIPSLSFAFHSEKNQGSWISGTFAITLTRLNDFNASSRYSGVNSHNSVVDYLTNDSYGLDPNSLLQGGDNYNTLNGLAYNNFLIEPNNQLNYFSVVGINQNDPTDVPRVKQQESMVTSGGQNQWSASYGVNIDDKFFFGAGLQLRSIRYESKKTYRESDYYFAAAPAFNPLDNMALEESLKISGSGYAATFGAMARPVDGLQIGLAYNTPTFYTLSDVYTARMSTNWNNFDYYGDGSVILNNEDWSTDPINSNYKLKTPGRVTGGATYFFGKSGFISGEVEAVNYAGSKYTSKTDGYYVDPDNATIKNLYKDALNVRVGGEYRLKNFRFRGGMGRMGEPFREKQNGISRSVTNLSCGVGYKATAFSLDAALTYKMGKNSYRPYSVPGNFSPLVNFNNQTTSFLVTLAIPF